MSAIELYTTNYPRHEPQKYIWFDAAVYGTTLPDAGNLPSAVFNKLCGGQVVGGYRQYPSEEEAVADLLQTGCVRETTKPKPSRRSWAILVGLELIKEGCNCPAAPHLCPHRAEIHDDNTQCTCCDQCEQKCKDDI